MSCKRIRTCKLPIDHSYCMHGNSLITCFESEFKSDQSITNQPENKPMNYLENPVEQSEHRSCANNKHRSQLKERQQLEPKDEPDANVFITRTEFQELLDAVYGLAKAVNKLTKED